MNSLGGMDKQQLDPFQKETYTHELPFFTVLSSWMEAYCYSGGRCWSGWSRDSHLPAHFIVSGETSVTETSSMLNAHTCTVGRQVILQHPKDTANTPKGQKL